MAFWRAFEHRATGGRGLSVRRKDIRRSPQTKVTPKPKPN